MPFPAIALAAAPLLGRIFGGAAKGAADQRSGENDQRLRAAEMANRDALGRGQLQSSHALNSAGLDLNRRQFLQNEPNAQSRQALVGSLLNRIQPMNLSGMNPRVRMPQFNSIIDAIGPEARQAGSLLSSRGLSGLESGPSKFDPIPALNLPPAQVAALQKSGLLEKILGWGGLIGSTVGALGDLGQNKTGGDGFEYGGGE